MSINIFWESERGEIMEKCPSWFNPWTYMDHPDELDGTCCLRFIHEYGDTTFNQYHLPVLVQELESMLRRAKTQRPKNR